jgi:hypothetical protein
MFCKTQISCIYICLIITCSLPMFTMITATMKSVDTTFHVMHRFLFCFTTLVLYPSDCPMVHDFALGQDPKLSDSVGAFVFCKHQVTSSGRSSTVLLWRWKKKTRKQENKKIQSNRVEGYRCQWKPEMIEWGAKVSAVPRWRSPGRLCVHPSGAGRRLREMYTTSRRVGEMITERLMNVKISS